MSYGPTTQRRTVEILHGVFGKVTQRISKLGDRAQCIVEMADGGVRRTAHLVKHEDGRWMMALSITTDDRGVTALLGEVTYDGT